MFLYVCVYMYIGVFTYNYIEYAMLDKLRIYGFVQDCSTSIANAWGYCRLELTHWNNFVYNDMQRPSVQFSLSDMLWLHLYYIYVLFLFCCILYNRFMWQINVLTIFYQ